MSVFGGPAWTWDEAVGAWYHHAYLPEQPDLNWRNPDVRTAMMETLSFWLDRGADGFRIDALRQSIKDHRWRDNPANPTGGQARTRTTRSCPSSPRTVPRSRTPSGSCARPSTPPRPPTGASAC